MNPKDVAVAARDVFAGVTGIKAAYEYDEEQLKAVPAVTLSLQASEPADVYTGVQDMQWRWIVRLYLPFGGRVAGSDFQAVDDLQNDLVARLFTAIRHNRDLGGKCLRAELRDVGQEPDKGPEAQANNVVAKLLELRAWTEEI